MKSTIKSVGSRVFNLYERVANRRFYFLKKEAKGMLSPAVYKTVYDSVYPLPQLDIIEIGGASGAGSIAIAWALKDAGKTSKLVVIEKCEGGSRADTGGYNDNLKIIENNFKRFGVEQQTVLYPHGLTFENGSEVISLLQSDQIAALIHDADGRLDRDFFLFWPLLQPCGLIIIDDYAESATFKPVSDRYPQGGAKKLMTFRLLNQMMEWGLFKPSEIKGSTIFGYKPPEADFSRFDLEVCNHIISGVQQERMKSLDV